MRYSHPRSYPKGGQYEIFCTNDLHQPARALYTLNSTLLSQNTVVYNTNVLRMPYNVLWFCKANDCTYHARLLRCRIYENIIIEHDKVLMRQTWTQNDSEHMYGLFAVLCVIQDLSLP